MRVLFCGETFPAARLRLTPRLPPDELLVCPEAAIRRAAVDVDVVIPLMMSIDGAHMDAGRFRLIQQWGVGLEGIDLEAARARGLWLANVPSADSGNADSVAEHALLLILALLRQLPAAQANVRAGVLGAPLGRALTGCTVCLFGLGAVARALARRLDPLDVRLVGISRRPDAVTTAALGLAACYSLAERDAALAQADVLVLCMTLTRETRRIIDAAALAALSVGAYLVNVARGPLIDCAALHTALASGRLAGAGLECATKAQGTSGCKFHPSKCRYNSVAIRAMNEGNGVY